MNIEDYVFKNCSVEFDKLISSGFKKIDNKYIISKNILDNSFQINVEIFNSGKIKIKVIDLLLNDEYINYKIKSQNGKFVNEIRKNIENFLIDIKNNCTKSNYFILPQANRIANLIKNKYHDDIEFLWENAKEHGVFRNKNSRKWYALIMEINKNKIDKEDKNINILNVKLDEDKIKKLLKQDGFYKAYHMNKKNGLQLY